MNGAVLATWASRVPDVQQTLGLTAGHLGLALLGMGVGALPAMSLAAKFIERYGSRRVARFTVLLLSFSLILPALAVNGPCLFAALLLLGGCSGALNVAENAQGATIENGYGRPVMASFHALFSVGGLCGSLLGALMASKHIQPGIHLTLVAMLLTALAGLTGNGLLIHSEPKAPTKLPLHDALRPLFGLIVIAFCTVLSEGAIADWSAVYLRKEVAASAGTAVLGYSAFALAMVVGRSAGDWLGLHFGDRRVVRGSALLGASGLGFALLAGGVPATIIGFACVGLGCASVYPTMIRACAKLPHISSGAAIAVISTAGYMGFFIGPPFIGLLADHVTLRGALLTVVAASGMIVLFGSSVGSPRDSLKRLIS